MVFTNLAARSGAVGNVVADDARVERQ